MRRGAESGGGVGGGGRGAGRDRRARSGCGLSIWSLVVRPLCMCSGTRFLLLATRRVQRRRRMHGQSARQHHLMLIDIADEEGRKEGDASLGSQARHACAHWWSFSLQSNGQTHCERHAPTRDCTTKTRLGVG